ncbi:MAG: thioredoxin [Anaerolineaceae bacterium]|nr:thioredoxin [Anaerolineaceae bacterium]
MNTNAYLTKLQTHSRPVVVDVWAPWCKPCRMMQPALDKVAGEYQSRVDVWKVNADEHPDLVRALRVMSIPTLIGFNQGKEVSRQIGVKPEASLRTLFEGVLTGKLPRRGPTPVDRILRISAGVALVAVGWFTDKSALLMASGGLVLFSAFYDRCPVWQALVPRLGQWLRRDTTSESEERRA